MARAAAASRSAPTRTAPRRAPARRKAGPAAPAKSGPPRKPRAGAATRSARPARKTPARKPATMRKPARKPVARTRTAPRRQPPLPARPLVALAAVPGTLVAAARGGALLDRLLRGRAWVLLVGALLAGIVFFNVSLLELNSGITRTSAKSSALKRENAQLRARVAELGSSERIQRLAEARGMYLPEPGDVRYARSSPEADGKRAARRLAEADAVEPPTPVTAAPPVAEAPAPAPAAPEPAPAAPPATAQTAPVPADPALSPGG